MSSGLDRIARGDDDAVRAVRGKRIGLVAHPASVDSRFTHASEVLQRAGAKIAAYFGPEHGFGGEAQDMIGVEGARAPDGAPIHSLYGATFDALSPRAEWMHGLDAIVIDLQDIGSRYYTFVWTAALVLRAASAIGVPTIVLDRENPLGNGRIEGAPQRPGYRSFVGLYDVPVRHGMTIGEVVERVRVIEQIDRDALHVVAHGEGASPWVLPSPNMPTLDTARVYPGGCLLEGTNLSEGRGTTRPFEIFGAPFVDGRALSSAVSIEGAVLRPLTFQPTFHKHARAICGGVQVHVIDEARFEPYAAYVRILAAIRAQCGDAFAWRTEAYEFVSDRPAIDLLTGGPEVREAIDAGADIDAWAQSDREACAEWKRLHPRS